MTIREVDIDAVEDDKSRGHTLLTTLGSIIHPLPTLQAQALALKASKNLSSSNTADAHACPQEVSRKRHLQETGDSAAKGTDLNIDGKGLHPTKRKKRTRFSENPKVTALRLEISNAAEELKRDGIQPNTLFFPSFSSEFKTDSQLRDAIGKTLVDLKTVQKRGNKMAWASFNAETHCVATLLGLKLKFPALKVSLHRKRQDQHQGWTYQDSREKNGLLFDKKVSQVLSRGGLGNTLILRNLPVEVECDELDSILRRAGDGSDASAKPLRIRTAPSKGKSARNFWLVYSGVNACRSSFILLMLKHVSFRCGRTTKLHPMVHDDSTDVDENKRRKRAIALGPQESTNVGSPRFSFAPEQDNVALLEHFLRSSQGNFMFLHDSNVMAD